MAVTLRARGDLFTAPVWLKCPWRHPVCRRHLWSLLGIQWRALADQRLSLLPDSLFVLDVAAPRSCNVRWPEESVEVSGGTVEFLFCPSSSLFHFLHHAARRGDRGDSAASSAGDSNHARSRRPQRLG